jgi:hypothetical protein
MEQIPCLESNGRSASHEILRLFWTGRYVAGSQENTFDNFLSRANPVQIHAIIILPYKCKSPK